MPTIRRRNGAPDGGTNVSRTSVYTRGLNVYTTILKNDQDAAYNSGAHAACTRIRSSARLSRCRNLCRHDPTSSPTRTKRSTSCPAGLPAIRPTSIPGSRPDADAEAEIQGVPAKAAKIVEINGDGPQVRRSACLTTRRPPTSACGAAPSIRVQTDEKNAWQHHPDAGGRVGAFLSRPTRRNPAPFALAGRRFRFQPQQVQPRDTGMAATGFELQALHLFRVRWKRASRPRQSLTTRRFSLSRPRSPAAKPGNRRTTTANSKARCACARRSPNRKTWCRFACSRLQRRAFHPGLRDPLRFSTPTNTRPT